MAVNWHEVFPVTSASATDIHREKTKTATPPPALEPKLIRPIAIHAHIKMYAEGIVADYTGAATKTWAPV
jgi:hypothetical protein